MPALNTANIATGYHIVLWLNSDTVSVSCKPYRLTKAVHKCVARSFTWKKSSRSWVAASVKPAISPGEDLNNGECLGSSKAHCHTVKSAGSVRRKEQLSKGKVLENSGDIHSISAYLDLKSMLSSHRVAVEELMTMFTGPDSRYERSEMLHGFYNARHEGIGASGGNEWFKRRHLWLSIRGIRASGRQDDDCEFGVKGRDIFRLFTTVARSSLGKPQSLMVSSTDS